MARISAAMLGLAFILAAASVSGARIPALDYDMVWVGPADGWTVAG